MVPVYKLSDGVYELYFDLEIGWTFRRQQPAATASVATAQTHYIASCECGAHKTYGIMQADSANLHASWCKLARKDSAI